MHERSAAQSLTLVLGFAFLALAIIGFVPGLTIHYGEMSFAGDDSGSELLGVFGVSILRNLVYLLFGVAGLSLSRSWDGSRTYLLGGGSAFLLLWLLGLAERADWLPANAADDWLHLVLGVIMVGGGVLTTRGGAPATT
jgi:hypothetical protein